MPVSSFSPTRSSARRRIPTPRSSCSAKAPTTLGGPRGLGASCASADLTNSIKAV